MSRSEDAPLDKSKLDYSVYLITARGQIPAQFLQSSSASSSSPSKEQRWRAHLDAYVAHLDVILRSGAVTMLQLREKDLLPDHVDGQGGAAKDVGIDNGPFLELAQKSLQVCDRYSIPMLINDNIAVTLALPRRVGLHIGQSDLPAKLARQLIGEERLLGLSVKTVEQARTARTEGVVDYVGIGAVYGTASKSGIEQTLGPRGAARIVSACDGLPCVLIGGINRQTARRALYGAGAKVNGLAVISDIYGSEDPAQAAKELHTIVSSFRSSVAQSISPSKKSLLDLALDLHDAHRSSSATPPLVQTITSHVSSTLSANVALCFSSSPIMSHEPEEAADLAKIAEGGVVLNIGTIGRESRKGMKEVGREANRHRKPVVLDPVGVGASTFRKEVVEEILNQTQITLIKGNAAELATLSALGGNGQVEVQARGVDSGPGTLSDPHGLVKSVAQRERCLVLLTGKTDYLTDGETVVECDNGHPLLGRITGSGCALGVALSAGMARACKEHPPAEEGLLQQVVNVRSSSELLAGALLGLLTITIASEVASEKESVQGPGTFIPAWLDAIANMDRDTLQKRAKIRST